MNRIRGETFYKKMHLIFENFSRVAMVNSDYETIFLKHQTLADIATLSQSAEVAHKYLQVQDGDIVLANDPYSGGTLLSSPTLIIGVGTKSAKSSTPSEFLISSRLSFLPRVGDFKTLDNEGLRIPPSPFYIKGEINTPIVEALKSHPLVPPQFMERIIVEAEKLLHLRDKLKFKLTTQDLDLTKANLKEYFQTTTEQFLKRLEDFGEGNAQLEYQLSNEESIKLKLEHHDGYFNFDFTGTTVGNRIFMTDIATFGTVVGTTLSLLQEEIPINSGLLNRFDVKAPRGSLVNSNFPRSLHLGHTEGVNIIANLVSQAFGIVHKKQAWAASGPSHCSYELKFRDGRILYDSLATGVGATEKGQGLNGVFLWRRSQQNISIEKWENLHPVQVTQSGFRSNSGGDGKNLGGNGVSRTLLLLEEADFSWSYIAPLHQPEGIAGGKSALGPEILVKKKGQESEKLSQFGSMKLEKGDAITVLTAGGGGCGSK